MVDLHAVAVPCGHWPLAKVEHIRYHLDKVVIISFSSPVGILLLFFDAVRYILSVIL